MLLALATLAVLDAVVAPTVELTLTGSGGVAVSAAPRSLSDVARERREGRKAVGGFSAVETTVPRGPIVVPDVGWEAESPPEREPQVVPEPPFPYVVPFVSDWYGGGHGGARYRGHHVRHALRPSTQPVPRPVVRPLARPGSPSSLGPRVAMPRHSGRRPG